MNTRAFEKSEVLDRLRIGNTKFHELLASGELKSFTIGRKRLVSEHALAEFIERREKAQAGSR